MMDNRRRTKITCTLLSLVLAISSCASPAPISSENKPIRILFVGNSLSSGLNNDLCELASVSLPPVQIEADTSTSSGIVLEGLWSEKGNRHNRILKGSYDFVVIQPTLSKTGKVYGGLTSDTEDTLHKYAALFDEEIRRGGGRTVLLMHWQFNEAESMPVQEIARVCSDVAARLGILVAPAGLAWDRSQKNQPKLVLLSDSVHASIAGVYLTACVLYATIFQKSPVGLEYVPLGWTEKEALFLQRLAWDTFLDYRQPSGSKANP